MSQSLYLKLVIVISIFFSLLNSAPFFRGLISTPDNKVFLGTVHYYEDFFFYVSQFYQGDSGKWLPYDLYTAEKTSPTVVYWQNLLLGKLFAPLSLPAEYSYNVSLIILTFIRLNLTFLLIKLFLKNDVQKSFLAFIFQLLATSFLNYTVVNGKSIFVPFILWRTPQFAFFRLGGVPHHALETIFFILLAWIYFRYIPLKIPYFILLFVLALALTSVNPVAALLFIFAIIISILSVHTLSLLFKKSDSFPNLSAYYLKLIPIIIGFIFCYSYLAFIHQFPPFSQVKIWERAQQLNTSPTFLLASIGPVVILAIIGLIPAVKTANIASIFIISLPVISYSLFLTAIPYKLGIGNFRLLFSSLYIFFGILASHGVFYLSKFLNQKLSVNKNFTVITLTSVFIVFSVPTLIWELNERISITDDKNAQIIYLDRPIFSGFKKLALLGSWENVVLANSANSFDTLVPALSGHKTYSGHILLTINSEKKKAASADFFRKKLTLEDGKKFLIENNIGYVFFTYLDGNASDFQNHYSFFKPVFENPSVAIFTF